MPQQRMDIRMIKDILRLKVISPTSTVIAPGFAARQHLI